MPGAHQLTVRIPTYSDGQGLVSGSNGSWFVNATITATPGVAPRHVLAVSSLYYGAINFETASQTAAFTAPAGTTYGWIEYRVTGHGGAYASSPSWPGCAGPAEEFCYGVNHALTVDGTALAMLSPIRDDCSQNCTLTNFPQGFASGQYCLQNPCGNIQSVEASRANWCPGTETPPFVLDGGALTQPGPHTLAWQVQGIDDGGGIWQTSVTYFAFGQ